MKNKIISAMLVGMSATMAVPATAVFAEDLAEPSALEEVAAETQQSRLKLRLQKQRQKFLTITTITKLRQKLR